MASLLLEFLKLDRRVGSICNYNGSLVLEDFRHGKL
jgi:hypothetical protein